MNCEHCGTPLAEGTTVCGVCGTPVQTIDLSSPAECPAPERVGLGFLGALVGALIGGASIVILSRLGFISAVSGILLAFCTTKGYELLAKTMSKKGVIICIILMLLTPFLADAIDWALVVYEEFKAYGAGVFECLIILPNLLADGAISMNTYLANLGMLYLFVALGGFATIRSALRRV